MSRTTEKVRRIYDELLAFLIHSKAENIKMEINRTDEGYDMDFVAGFSAEKGTYMAEKLNRFLSLEKNDGIEDYYCELAGEGDGTKDSELQLVGQMVDEGLASYDAETGQLHIRVFRKRKVR